MADYKSKMQYERYVPPAKPSSLFPLAYNFVLINTLEELEKVFEGHTQSIAFDTETTGLDLDKAFIVGYSFCMDGKNAYYVPVNHAEYETDIILSETQITYDEYQNNYKNDGKHYKYKTSDTNEIMYYRYTYSFCKPGLGEPSLDMLYAKLCEADQVFAFNARFDFRVLERHGFIQNNVPYAVRDEMMFYKYDMSKVNFIDAQTLVFLSDTNVPYPSLKKSEEYFLGWRGNSFEETLGDAENFYYLKPEDCYFYAATDALGTYLVTVETWKYLLEAKTSGILDNKFLYPLMIMENELTRIDVDRLKEFSEYYTKAIAETQETAYRIAGKPFNMGSPKQKSQVLRDLGINIYESDGFTLALNKKGELRADKEHLERAIATMDPKDDRRLLLECILKSATLNKQLSSYVDNIIQLCKDSNYDNRLRFAYKTMVVPSGRLAAGGDRKNSYFSTLNVQNITKPKIANQYYVRLDDIPDLVNLECYNNARQEYQLPSGENTYLILDWVFKASPWNIEGVQEYVIEGFSQKLNARSAFLPDDDKYWVSCDFSAQELRLPALITGEPSWTEVFSSGGDLHKATAINMWGKENYTKQKRKMAKKANFGILYGMTAKNFAEDFKITVQEGEEFVKKYKSVAPVLFRWVHENEIKAKNNGTVYTMFGRPRRLGWYCNNDNWGMKQFGFRSATNTVIQGSGADILKISFMNIFNKFFSNGNMRTNRKYIKFMNTVHDEINYNVSKENIRKIVPMIISCMRLQLPGWKFSMDVGLDIGTRWGQTVAFNYCTKREGEHIDISEVDRIKELGLKQGQSYDFKFLDIMSPAGDLYTYEEEEEQEVIIEPVQEDIIMTEDEEDINNTMFY